MTGIIKFLDQHLTLLCIKNTRCVYNSMENVSFSIITSNVYVWHEEHFRHGHILPTVCKQKCYVTLISVGSKVNWKRKNTCTDLYSWTQPFINARVLVYHEYETKTHMIS